MNIYLTMNDLESPLEGLCPLPMHLMDEDQLAKAVARIRAMRDNRRQRIQESKSSTPSVDEDFFKLFGI